MGRTIPTLKEAIRIEEAKCKNFRRQLSAEEKVRLGKVFEYARKLGDAGTMFARLHTPDAVYMCSLPSLIEEWLLVAERRSR
ncbi:MAG: hypothetical protein ACFFD9_04765 [Candidatus Thorarchaeota archaeon]